MKEANKKHSILGIVSCVIGCLMFFVFFVAVISAFLFELKMLPKELGGLYLLVILILPIPVHIFGLVLGAVTIFFPNRKKLFPILGTVSNLIFALASLYPWSGGIAP